MVLKNNGQSDSTSNKQGRVSVTFLVAPDAYQSFRARLKSIGLKRGGNETASKLLEAYGRGEIYYGALSPLAERLNRMLVAGEPHVQDWFETAIALFEGSLGTPPKSELEAVAGELVRVGSPHEIEVFLAQLRTAVAANRKKSKKTKGHKRK